MTCGRPGSLGTLRGRLGLNTATNQTIASEIANGFGDGIGADFQFVLDSTGHIDPSKGWIAAVSFNPLIAPGFGVNALNYLSSLNQGTGGVGAQATIDQTYTNDPREGALNGSARNENDPGTWTIRVSGVPGPEMGTDLLSTIPVLAVGLVLLWRRRQRWWRFFAPTRASHTLRFLT
jgi:hypothetical protein